jgi:peptidoglycan/LPS O-acetylase OafA/YrhL
VDIFFVLSGYIITARLLLEREQTSNINLRSFYVRRAFRILPLVLCYLTAICVISAFAQTETTASDVVGTLLFLRNYQFALHPVGTYTKHFWSLSIEEHFYLLWPVILFRLGNRRAIWIAAIGAYACAIWRIYDRTFPNGPVTRFLPGANEGLRSLRTDVRLDGLLLGSVLAILILRPVVREFMLRNFPKETPLVLGVFLMILNRPWAKGYGTLTYYSLLALIVASTLIVQEGLVYKALNSKLLVGIGTISYSLYVWQQIFLLHPEHLHPLGILGRFPYNLASSFAVAIGSYILIEKPAARLGKRLIKWSALTEGQQSSQAAETISI